MKYIDPRTGPKTLPGHERRIDYLEKHPNRAGGEWAGVQFTGVTVPGDGVFHDVVFTSGGGGAAFFYASPFDGELYSINLTDHKVYIADTGMYEFKLGWSFTGAGTITNANATFALTTTQNVMGGFISQYTGIGSFKARGITVQAESYPLDDVAFPQPVFLQASQDSGVDMTLGGQLVITRTCATAHGATPEPFPVADYPAGSHLP